MGEVLESCPINRHIGRAFNQYYNWTNNTAFYTLASPYLFNFYMQNVWVWDQWNLGYVRNFHNEQKGILPSQFASSLCQKVSDLIYGDGVIFNGEKKGDDGKAVDFVSNVLEPEMQIKRTIKDSVLKACQLGNSLLKINCNGNKLWLEALAGNRFFVDLDSRGNVVKSTTFVNIFTTSANNDKQKQSYGLVEERYWKDETNEFGDAVRKPYARYCIYPLASVGNTFTRPTTMASMKFEQLPRSVSRQFLADYGNIMLNEENPLPLLDLGVYHIKYTEYLTTMPNIKMGESCLAKIVNYLALYDLIFSEQCSDVYATRSKVIVPRTMGKDNQGYFNALDDFVYTQIPNKSDKEQQPIVFAPSMRSEQLAKARENVEKMICSSLGISVNSIFSDITNGGVAVTATQISSEDSNTVLFVNNKRVIFLPELNRMMKTILKFYGYVDNVNVQFTKAGSSNQSVVTQNVNTQIGNGTISRYEAIKSQNPNWTEAQVEEEMRQIDEERASESAVNEEKFEIIE